MMLLQDNAQNVEQIEDKLQTMAESSAELLKSGNWEEILSTILEWCASAGWNILCAILIYVVGRYIIKFIMKVLKNTMVKRKIDVSVQTFLISFVNITLMVLLFIAIVARLGIETTSFAALLASVGVAVGMAMSGNLNNLAGGLIVLLLRPYKVGDYIEFQSNSGTVESIQIFHTVLKTIDNKNIYIPNGSISSGTVINYSSNNTRMLEWVIGVEYGENYEKAQSTIQDIVNADSRILKNPAPSIVLCNLNSSSVDVRLRAWVKSADYWDVLYDVNRNVYNTFNREGIGFPFPQLTVHQAKD